MKSVLVSIWLVVSMVLGQVGGIIGESVLDIDWSQLGFAFFGATSYMMWEILKEKPIARSPAQQAMLVFIGLGFSLAFCMPVATKTGMPISTVAYGLAAIGYGFFTVSQRRVGKIWDYLSGVRKTAETEENEKTS